VVALRAMPGRTVHLRVGGQTYRVVTSASDEELQRLAAVVDQKLATVVAPGRMVTPQAMLLAAMALAHELEAERSRSATITAKARGAFGKMLERVDAALAMGQEPPAPWPDGVPTGRPANEPFYDGPAGGPKPRAPLEP
jgi:cell division protein ZapA